MTRDGQPLLGDIELWAADGTVHDRFVHVTEGVLPEERLGPPVVALQARITAQDARAYARGVASVHIEGRLGERNLRARVEVADDRVTVTAEASPEPLRLGLRWPAAPDERFIGLGARHGTSLDQSGRSVRLGADRRYTGPDCPPEMLALGGIPQADCAPVPWFLSSRGYGAWLETDGDGVLFDLGVSAAGGPPHVSVSARAAAGSLRLHLFTPRSPLAALRHYLRVTGRPALLPEWAYGHWKSRDVYEHQRDVEEDFEGYREHGIALDAIVLDSPWETQYNTWEFNPHQFPDAPGLIAHMRRAGVRTVVWVTPWVNLESSEGQYPPDPQSARLHREPAPNYAEAAARNLLVKDESGQVMVKRWWMGTGSPVDFTSPEAEEWWRGLAKRVLDLGVEGIKADDGEGYYLTDARFADGRTGAQAAWAYGALYRECMKRALDEAAPGRGVLFGRSGWSGQQRLGMLWGGDQASDFWSLAALVTATLAAAASGFSNWSHDIGGYLGERLVSRCPKELLLRWVQFGCFTPLMHAHGRFAQEAWTYDEQTLELYRQYVLLHERLVPYVRAAAATAARTGIPIVRPLALLDPGDKRGWTIPDAYGYGPALWVAPVLEAGVREREVAMPRGEWIDYWTQERVTGGVTMTATAPLERIPVWVRSGSVVVTYPSEAVAGGLGDGPEPERPLEATLWGRPRLGRAGARLADGTRVRWRKRGGWAVEPASREVVFAER